VVWFLRELVNRVGVVPIICIVFLAIAAITAVMLEFLM